MNKSHVDLLLIWATVFIFILAVTPSCGSNSTEARPRNPHKVNCNYVGNGIQRCENNEVVCYSNGAYGGISCFKLVLSIRLSF